MNIYGSNKSHKVKQSNKKENTVISEVFQKVFVGSEFWVLLILIINLGCYTPVEQTKSLDLFRVEGSALSQLEQTWH